MQSSTHIVQNFISQINNLKQLQETDDNITRMILIEIESLFSFLFQYGNDIFLKSEKFIVTCYYKGLELELQLKNEKKYNTPYIIPMTIKVIKTIQQCIEKIKNKFSDLLNKKNHSYLNPSVYNKYIETKIIYEKKNTIVDSDDTSESSDSDYENDSSSDFELDEFEDRLLTNMDNIFDENYSFFVDESDDEEVNDTYKRTFSRTTNKLNKEIVNSYKNKRRRTNTNKNNKTITKITNKTNNISDISMPEWTKKFISEYEAFDTPSNRIKSYSSSRYGNIDATKLTRFLSERINAKEILKLGDTYYMGIENFKRVYENDDCKLWEFINKNNDISYAYIFFDKTWQDWYALKLKTEYNKSDELSKFNKLAVASFGNYLVWKSSNPYNIIDIITPSINI